MKREPKWKPKARLLLLGALLGTSFWVLFVQQPTPGQSVFNDVTQAMQYACYMHGQYNSFVNGRNTVTVNLLAPNGNIVARKTLELRVSNESACQLYYPIT
jgi:hypothetical protein